MGEYQTVEGLLLSLGFNVTDLEAKRQDVLDAMDVITYNLNGAVSLEKAWNHYHDAARAALAKLAGNKPLMAKAIRHLAAATVWRDGGDYHRYQRSLVRVTLIAAEGSMPGLAWQLHGFINQFMKTGLELELSGSYERAAVIYENALTNSQPRLHDLGWLLYAFAFCLRQSAVDHAARYHDSESMRAESEQMLILANQRLRAAVTAFDGCESSDKIAGRNTVTRLRHDLAELLENEQPGH